MYVEFNYPDKDFHQVYRKNRKNFGEGVRKSWH